MLALDGRGLFRGFLLLAFFVIQIYSLPKVMWDLTLDVG